eukprot:gene1094-biopygen9280
MWSVSVHHASSRTTAAAPRVPALALCRSVWAAAQCVTFLYPRGRGGGSAPRIDPSSPPPSPPLIPDTVNHISLVGTISDLAVFCPELASDLSNDIYHVHEQDHGECMQECRSWVGAGMQIMFWYQNRSSGTRKIIGGASETTP